MLLSGGPLTDLNLGNMRNFALLFWAEHVGEKDNGIILQVIVPEIISCKLFIPGHAALDGLQHFWLFIKLVICKVNLLELFGDRDTIEHLFNTFVPKLISCQNQFFQLALLKDEDFEEGTRTFLINSTITQRKRLNHFICFQALAECVRTGGAEHIMIKFQKYDRWACSSWFQSSAQKLTSKM